MICNLFDFCPQSAQSHRHWGSFGGLSRPTKTKLQVPKLKQDTL